MYEVQVSLFKVSTGADGKKRSETVDFAIVAEHGEKNNAIKFFNTLVRDAAACVELMQDSQE